MNTDNNSPNTTNTDTRNLIGREIMSVLNSSTINMSIEQTLLELQICVERLTFGSESTGKDMTVNDVEGLLNGDVSEDTMTFLRWLHHRKILWLMFGANGRNFLSYCSEYYRKVQQVKVSTPIPLRDSFRTRLLTQLRVRYPEPARIVFEAMPSLIAGCIIDDSHSRVDMSLLNKSPEFIHEYLKKHMRQKKESHVN